MSASSSSRIDPAIGHLAALGQSLVDERSDVLSVLGQVADPRKRRGVRHTLPVILGVVVCAVLAGARSFVAIAEWAADADDATLADLGAGAVVPCESTIRRTLQTLDADALDDAFGGWAQARTKPSPAVRRRVAVDGKTLRGSGLAGGSGRHLLAALDHVHGVVLGQVDVAAKTNEIPIFATLLDRIDLRGAIVTADAMHAQRDVFATLTGAPARRYNDLAVLTTATVGFALGVDTVEGTKQLRRADAGAAVGLGVAPQLATLRARLSALADGSDPLALQRAFAAGMLAADPAPDPVYFVDDHFVAYS